MNDLEHFTRDAEAQIAAANKRADVLQEALSAAHQRADAADKRAAALLAEIQRLRELIAATAAALLAEIQRFRELLAAGETDDCGAGNPPPDYAAGKAC